MNRHSINRPCEALVHLAAIGRRFPRTAGMLAATVLGLLLCGDGLSVASSLGTKVAAAELVTFDVPRTVDFQPVAGGPWGPAPTGMADFEMCMPVSTLVRETAHVDELFLRIDFPMGFVEIVDYLPRTAMETNVAGKISVEQRSENGQTVGLSASGAYDKLITGNATAGVNSKDSLAVKYDLLPPLELVTATGTLHRRSAAYFKFKASSRGTLEGERKVVLVLRAPLAWRAGYAVVTCRAEGKRTNVPPLEDPRWHTQRSFLVAVYRRGDAQAQAVARQFSVSEQQLVASAGSVSSQVGRLSSRTSLYRLAAWFDLADPKVPPDWLDKIIWLPPDADVPTFVRHLPEETRKAIEQFLKAKQQLYESALATAAVASDT